MGMLKVSAQSNAIRAAGALANTIRQAGEAEIQAIGPKAVNQTVKAIAIARSYLASSGIDLVAIPSFVDVEIEGEPRTAVRFYVTPRHRLIEASEAAQAQAAAESAEAATSPPTPAPVPTSAPTPASTSAAPGGHVEAEVESKPETEPEPERTSSPPPEVLAGTMGSSTPTPTPASETDSGAETEPEPEPEPRPFSGDVPAPDSTSDSSMPETETEEEQLHKEGGSGLG